MPEDHPAPISTPAELRELLDRLSSLEEAAAQFDGHNEMACHEISGAIDNVLESAAHFDNCVVRSLGAIGLLLPEIAYDDTSSEERWDLMNNALSHVLNALDHIEELAALDQAVPAFREL